MVLQRILEWEQHSILRPNNNNLGEDRLYKPIYLRKLGTFCLISFVFGVRRSTVLGRVRCPLDGREKTPNVVVRFPYLTFHSQY